MFVRSVALAIVLSMVSVAHADSPEGLNQKQAQEMRMSRSLLNIAKRPLPRLTLRGVSLTSKDAVS